MLKYSTFILVVAYTSVTSALSPCVCTRNLKPVCGSDGVTYSNECMLNCQASKKPSLTLKSYGRCESDPGLDTCICTFEYKPVCGSDGVTYPNRCAFDCRSRSVENLEVVSPGPCKVKREVFEECFCTFDNNPICGSDGVTYPNKCAFDCRSRSVGDLEIVSDGPCSSELRKKRDVVKVANIPICKCTKEGNPVCGSDGKTYGNPCTLDCMKAVFEDLHIEHTGRCKSDEFVPQLPEDSSGCSCTREMQPVCASNSVTYTNVCLMNCADESLTVAHLGPCEV